MKFLAPHKYPKFSKEKNYNIFSGLNCSCWPLSVYLSVGRYIHISIAIFISITTSVIPLSVARYFPLPPFYLTNPSTPLPIRHALTTYNPQYLPLYFYPAKQSSCILPGTSPHFDHSSKVGRVLRLQCLSRRHPCK